MRHHPLLHSNVAVRATETNSSAASAVTNLHLSDRTTLFKIIPVTVHNGSRSLTVHAFLDDGSSMTLVNRTVAEALGVDGEAVPLCLQWTANVTRSEKDSKRVSFEISGVNSKQRYVLSDVRTVNDLSLPRQSLKYVDLVCRYPHLSGLPVQDYHQIVPQILIGNNHSYLSANLKIREGGPHDPIAAKTRLGWSVYGVVKPGVIRNVHNLHICECTGESLHDLVKQHFSLENLGVAILETPMSIDDHRARQILQRTTKRIGNRFETGLLWRYDDFEFPDSYSMAVRRMECLERRMAADSIFADGVRKQINQYIEKGYIRIPTQQELLDADPRRTWFLPLGVALHPKKPNKVRIFCDAAAKVDGISLNSMLMKGPDLLTALPTVLYGFRQRKIAFSADIQEMFHQILIRREDRNAQRVLWRDNPIQKPTIYVMDVATFGASCSPCSAHFIKNLNASQYSKEYPLAADAIIRKHYVDDYLDSVDSVEEAVVRAQEVRFIHSRGGFHIRHWLSNSDEFLQTIGESSPNNEKTLDFGTTKSMERVLGILWRPEADVFTYHSTSIVVESRPTKRQVLRTVMSLFDPLGFLSFFLIHGKILIQDIWRAKTDWDEVIPENLRERWLKWTNYFAMVDQIEIPRCYFPQRACNDFKSLQLHVFADASEGAFACVVYLRAEFENEIKCALVTAKAKVAPLKAQSIPRLELQAATIGVRLQEMIISAHELPITKKMFWTDSRTVLSWINSDHRNYRQFVAVRVGEILTQTNTSEWRWVPSKSNPADAATKWGKGPCMATESPWFRGPDFLYLPENQWPEEIAMGSGVSEELRICLLHNENATQTLIDWNRFSQWNRLQRAMAYAIRYIHNLRHSTKQEARISGPLRQEELEKAESSIWRAIQLEAYPDEILILAQHREHPLEKSELKLARDSKLRLLSPVMDTRGVLRLEGRTALADYLSYETKNPIILPANHSVVKLLINWYHRKYLHGNSETVLNEIKQRFHISHLRAAVRRQVKACVLCRIKGARPAVPRMAPLPKARLRSFERPFSYVGVDYFGPILVKLGRSCVKRWVAVFTCLTIRAIHLEVVHTLSTESCKLAFRRFIARRGSPLEIYSDNGTNFVGASNDLRRELDIDQQQLAETFTNTITKWFFNPPSAPHMGGSWERMVRSVKTALAAMSFAKHPDDETFVTVISEAESIINSRPLTFIPLESPEQEALTPNHFLLLSSSGVAQPLKTFGEQRLALRSNWNLCRSMVDQFWRRWVREYLPTITRRTKWFADVESIKPNDLVIVVDESIRNGWKRGRVLEVIEGADGRARRAVVQTDGGIMRRPVAKLARLDLERCKSGTNVKQQIYGSGNVTESRTASSAVLSTGLATVN
ncbi:uncharacterized protein LOC131430702 [Malaya genurostris]|uniref:uncharacterized protein LOC131430702 n=1 Tax=Malaya genurostris TaxID=325434 RepID=UPI0026F3E35B|nr:uncharacterized protein LOC131430702 [Malaya genurostris]